MEAVTNPAVTITTQAAFEAHDLALWMWTKPWIEELDKYSSITKAMIESSLSSLARLRTDWRAFGAKKASNNRS